MDRNRRNPKEHTVPRDGLDEKHEEVREDDSREDPIDKLGLVPEECGTRSDRMRHQHAEHHGHRGGTGDAERKSRDKGAACHRVVARFARDHAIRFAFTKVFCARGMTLRLVVGEEVRDRSSLSGKGTDKGTEEARAEEVLPTEPEVAEHFPVGN